MKIVWVWIAASASLWCQPHSTYVQWNSSPAPSFPKPTSLGRPAATPSLFRPSTPQRSLPPHMQSWGGTVTGSADSRTLTFTCNFAVPAFSVVTLRRGPKVLQLGEIATCSGQTGLLILAGGLQPEPGDGVFLESVPAPPPAPLYQPQMPATHSTLAQADPTYQRWLRQGFTLGGWCGSRPYSRSYRY